MEQKPEKFSRKIRKEAYDSLADWEDVTKGIVIAKVRYNNIKNLLKEHGLDLKKDLKVLEIGSGNSVFLDYLRNQGMNVIGVDVRPRGSSESPQLLARIEQLPFRDESFDLIFSGSVFDRNLYEQDHNLMMQEITRVLKPGGFYVGRGIHGIYAAPIDGLSPIPNDRKLVMYKKS